LAVASWKKKSANEKYFASSKAETKRNTGLVGGDGVKQRQKNQG